MVEPLRRAPDAQEHGQMAAALGQRFTSFARAAHSSGNEGWMLVGIALVLVPIVGVLPFEHDALLLRGFLWAFLGVLVCLGLAGVVGGRREGRRRVDRLAALHRETLAEVLEYRLVIDRVLGVTDGDGEGYEWWLLGQPGGFLGWAHEGLYGVEPAQIPWRQQVTLVTDRGGFLVRVSCDGEPVPVHDGTLKAPDFVEVPGVTAYWSPSPDAPPDQPTWVTDEALARDGQWPDGLSLR